MRFVLRDGTREVIVFSRHRFASFQDLEHAAESLLRYVEDPKNLENLRKLLIEDPDYAHLAHTDPAALVTRVAHMVLGGRLQLLPHPDALPPWSWPFPTTPTHPTFDAGAEGGGNPLAEEGEPLEEAEDDRLDVKPDPVIPPEFPRMAEREAEAMLLQSKLYGFAMDVLRFFGEKLLGEPDLPRALLEMAIKTGDRLRDEVEASGGALTPLALGGMPALNGSTLGAQLTAVAKQGGVALREGAQKTGELLAALALGAPKDAGTTRLGPVFIDLARTQTQKLGEAAQGAGGQFIQLVTGQLTRPNPAAVPAMLVQMAGKNAGAVVAAAAGAGAVLKLLNQGDVHEPGTPEVAPRLAQIGAENAQRLEQAAAGATPALDALKPSAEELAAQPPKVGPNDFAFTLLDGDNQPVVGQAWRITRPDGTVVSGVTDAHGRAKVGHLPVGSSGTLELPGFQRLWRDTAGTLPGPTIHVVQAGDWLSKIAQKYGFANWRDIYDHPENAPFRAQRPDPNLVQPGDRIFIPETKPRRLTFRAGTSVSLYPVGLPAPAKADQQAPPPKPGPYQPQTGPYQSPYEGQPPPTIKPAPRPATDDVVLIDDAGMLYKVPAAMFAQMQDGHRKLAAIRDKIKKAKDLPYDRQANASELALKELEALCGGVTNAAGVQTLSSLAANARPIRQFIDPRSMTLVFTPGRLQRELEALKYPGKWSRERLRDVVDFRRGAAVTTKEKLQQAKADAQKKGTLSKLNIEARFRLTDWEDSLSGEGSLLDLIDSGNPTTLRTLLFNPSLAPVVLLDALAEKFPTVLRKKHGTQNYFFDENNPNWSDSWEASFLRWSYGVKDIAVVWQPGKVKIGGSVAGSVSLVSAKGEVALDLPTKDGVTLPIPTKDGSKFRVRVHVVGRAAGFVGATAELSCEAVAPTLGLAKNAQAVATKTPSNTPLELGINGGLKLFAGASATLTGELGLEWFNLEKNAWKSLGKVIGEATGIAGAALEVTWALGWNSKTRVFEFELKCKAALKLGGGAGVRFEVGVNEIGAFLSEMFARTDWVKIREIAAEAFEAYVRFQIGLAVKPALAAGNLLWDAGRAFLDWTGKQAEVREVALNITSGKANAFLKTASPEARAAVIAKLCERSMFLPDEVEEEAILRVLETIPTRRAVELTLARVDPVKKTVAAGIAKIDWAVDWAEQRRFDEFLKRHGVKR